MFYHYDEPGWFSNKDGTYPVLLYEQERLVSKDISWLINFGIPSMVGLGLKWYF
jgi:hypothetical protein